MEAIDEPKKLSEWLKNLVTKFREEYEKLSELEKSKFSNSDDYRFPCQLEVFWLKESLEFQILVIKHDEDRKDEIIVNGPYRGFEFVEKTEQIMQEPRWSKKIPHESPFLGAKEGTLSYSDVFAGVLYNFLNSIRDSIFLKWEKTIRFSGLIFAPKDWVWLFYGNMGEMDYEKTIEGIMNEAKAILEKPKEQQVAPAPPKIKGFGTYFYPPIWVGEPPEPTFKEKVSGSYFPWPSKAFDASFGKFRAILNTDGFIALNVEDKSEAIRLLNTIIGTALMTGVLTFAVRESEIAEVGIDPNGFTIAGTSMRISGPRTMLFDWISPRHVILPYERKSIEKGTMITILEKAEKIFQYPDKAEQLTFLLEAYTELQNSEYAQSFTLSWIVLEKHIFNLWYQFLDEKGVNGKRKRKLKNPVQWSLDYVLEALNLNGILRDDEYNVFNMLKDKRNKFIHRGEPITEENATRCFDLAYKITNANLSQLFQ